MVAGRILPGLRRAFRIDMVSIPSSLTINQNLARTRGIGKADSIGDCDRPIKPLRSRAAPGTVTIRLQPSRRRNLGCYRGGTPGHAKSPTGGHRGPGRHGHRLARDARLPAQAPVLQESGLLPSGVARRRAAPNRSWGRCPGAGESWGCSRADEMLFGGRAGLRCPACRRRSRCRGGRTRARSGRSASRPPSRCPPQPPFYGTLEVAEGPEDPGPPDGLTLDQAIEIYVHQNLDLRSLSLELPQARADVLTASLRANPILYADSQLIPYGSFNRQRPGGPTQYDLNISHPIDFSHKRHGPDGVCRGLLRVTEHQYQDAVRRGINDLYLAYVDVLAARRTVHYRPVFARGTDKFLSGDRGPVPEEYDDQSPTSSRPGRRRPSPRSA